MIDETISATMKTDGVFGGMENDMHVSMDEWTSSQSEKQSQHAAEEEPKSPRTRASNLHVVRG